MAMANEPYSEVANSHDVHAVAATRSLVDCRSDLAKQIELGYHACA